MPGPMGIVVGKILEYPPCFMLKLPIVDQFFWIRKPIWFTMFCICFAWVLVGEQRRKHAFFCVFTCPPYLAHKPFKAKSRMREMKKLQRFSGVSWWGSWCVKGQWQNMFVLNHVPCLTIHKGGAPSYCISWFINPINYWYIYHKP